MYKRCPWLIIGFKTLVCRNVVKNPEKQKNWPYGWIELLYFQYFVRHGLASSGNEQLKKKRYNRTVCLAVFQFFESQILLIRSTRIRFFALSVGSFSSLKFSLKTPVRIGKAKLKLPNISCESFLTFHGRCKTSCTESGDGLLTELVSEWVKIYSIDYLTRIIFRCSAYFLYWIVKTSVWKTEKNIHSQL